MSNDTVLWQEWEGLIVPKGFSIGYVVLSYVVSYVGTWTTLELLNKRTAGRGLYNWSLLFGSSISMGGIAIWCMHYIGNRATVLGGGQSVLQIAYNPGFTALSFFVPILVLLVAFTALGSNDRVSIIRVSLGGTLAGSAICGMHYLGQEGISNYTCIYNIGNIVGSAAIAVTASVVALSVFFVLRATWTNSWWKRALCAIVLAGAVSGMHWLASVGTQYRLKHVDAMSSFESISRNSTVIVVIVLSIAACFILLISTMLAQRRKSRSATRAQEVVLACAIFDPSGRIMVTPDGLLPNRKVTTSYVERSLDGIFGISHPVFHWIFRATRNWGSVSDLLPSMRKHLYHTSTIPGSHPEYNSEVHLRGTDGDPSEDYSIIFRELFCIAAADLAEELGERLENIGVLFDDILNTGRSGALNSGALWGMAKSPADLERDGVVIRRPGRGLLLFLVRQTDRRTAEKLSASGYRFAETQNVVHIITNRMQINCSDLQGCLNNMHEYASESHILRPGVHVACFAVRASVGGGFDVLVRKDARNQLPTIRLSLGSLDDWEIGFLSQLDNCSLTSCLKFLSTKSVSSEAPIDERTFAKQLLDALGALKEEVSIPLFADALLVSRPVSMSCGVGANGKSGQVSLIVFRLLLPIQSRTLGQKVAFAPLSLFRLQQFVYKNGSDHALFSRKIHREFGPFLNEERSSIDVGLRSARSMTFLGRPRKSFKIKRTLSVRTPFDVSIPTSKVNSDSSSERKLVQTKTFGGILVSQEVSIDIKDLEDGNLGRESNDGMGGIEMAEMRHAEMGTSGRVTKEAEEPETFVDTLFALCIESR